MRPASRALLALALALPAGAAQAQVQQNDPNAANASFALQGQIRALNQQRVSDFNTLNQTIQRNVQFESFGPVLPYRGIRGGVRGESMEAVISVATGVGGAVASTRASASAAERPGYPRRAGTARKKPLPTGRLRPQARSMVACA